MGHVKQKGLGRKKRLGQLKIKRPDMPVDKEFLKLLEDMKLVGQVLYVKSDAGVLCDLTNLAQSELQKINLEALGRGFIVQRKGKFYNFVLLT